MNKLVWFILDEIFSSRPLAQQSTIPFTSFKVTRGKDRGNIGESTRPPPPCQTGSPSRTVPPSGGKQRPCNVEDTIPDNNLADMVQVPIKLEKAMWFALLLCMDGLLHDLTFMPLQAISGATLLGRQACQHMCQRGLRALRGISSTTDSRCNAECAPTISLDNGSLFNVRRRTKVSDGDCGLPTPEFQTGEFLGGVSAPEACAMTRALLLVASVWCFSNVDISRVYHFIRGQSLMKLYVVFNMLEIFERMWRSFGKDSIDSLMKETLRLFHDPPRSAPTDKTLWRSRTWGIWVKLGLQFIGVVVYVIVHCFMHLVRVLALNIAINSSESAMFLIVITNNFGEIKSSVFKRHNAGSVFQIFASDVVERFQLCCDSFIVFMRVSASNRLTQSTNFSWLLVVFFAEVIVDAVKHCFILKFNLISCSEFDKYKLSLVADLVVSRAPQCETVELGPSQKLPAYLDVPCRHVYSFSHIPCRRLGFMSTPLLTLILCCVSVVSWSDPKAWLLAYLIWQSLFFLKVALSIVLVSYAIKRCTKLSDVLEGTALKQLNAL